ncbi:hypothetical protein V5738_10840 [Salinisphaera sp. SPP-AMP-43]|uniref:hypothetical protein n=1 Tax=Salinisphaera sp. SPP-AMP-43 TaxID=3121288 RepID=UPI003C6DBFFC
MAEYGLRVRSPAGVYTLTPDDRISRIIGSVDTGTSSGSHSDSRLRDGEPFFFLVPHYRSGEVFSNVSVSIDHSGLSWKFQNPSSAVNYTIYYGLY